IKQILLWSEISRKEGLLALESYVQIAKDPLAKKGLQLLADGSQPDKLREAMEVECFSLESYQRQSARIWEAAGGYAPTIGILGAVLGLIHVMENLSDPDRLGSGIAVAFVATIYGVGLANLIFLPVSNKLKALVNRDVVRHELLAEAFAGIAAGDNPRLIEERMAIYLL